MNTTELFTKYRIHDPTTVWGAIFYAVLFLLAAWLCNTFFRIVVKKAIHYDKRGLIDRTAAPFLLSLIRIGILLIFLVVYAHWIPALHKVGSALLAGASVASVVLGLAAQNTLGNIMSGMSILMYRPFGFGDRLQVETPEGAKVGVVESVTLGHTVLATWDNKRVVIPNSKMANQTIVNMSSVDPANVVSVPINVGYSCDVLRAHQILTELAKKHENVTEVIGCPVTELGSSGVTVSLRAHKEDGDDERSN